MEENDIITNIIKSNKNFFITGKAGTGKTTLIKILIEKLKKINENFVILAPTGIAALNVNGVTIHSFFEFAPGIIIQKAGELGENNKGDYKYTKLDYIIIDEISMVRADLLDCIDIFLRKVIGINKPFGGIKMIFVGDLYQLPPIIENKEKNIFLKKYKSSFFFSSNVFLRDNFKLELIELKKIYRQENKKFINTLNNIRKGKISIEELKYINSAFYHNTSDKHIILTTTNKEKNKINNEKLKEIKRKEFTYNMILKGKVDYKDSILERTLKLKMGARVMFLVNHPLKSYVNGTLGNIVYLDKDKIIIKKDNNEEITIFTNDYIENIYEYVYDYKIEKISKRSRGQIIQVPLKLAWATTIHKAQGLTYEKISIDFGEKGCWESGQAYVALSRVKSFEGLNLRRPIDINSIKADENIEYFLDNNINSEFELDFKNEQLDISNYKKEIFFGDKGGINYFNVAKSIIKKIDLEGGKAYIVGGFCRNRIKGLSSFTDIDISTDLTPENIKSHFNVVNAIGEDFGVLVIKEFGFIYEITTFRKDKNRKSIIFSNKFKEDANRRDFTINAIYLDPLRDEYILYNNVLGKIVKSYSYSIAENIYKNRQDGIYDLNNNIIRFIGSPLDRIKEDPIRLLRYVRFKYGLELRDYEEEQYKIVKENFLLLKNIAFERIKVEIEKIFIGNNVVNALKALKKLGFFKIFIPEIDNLDKCPGGPKYHLEGDVWIHTLLIIEYLHKQNIKNSELYWIALFHDTGKLDTHHFKEDGTISYIGHEELSKNIFLKYIDKLKFTKKEKDKISWIIEKHLLFGRIIEMKKIKQRKLFLHKYWNDFFIFGDADNNGRLPINSEVGKKINKLYNDFYKKYYEIKLYTGEDIIKKYPQLTGKKIGIKLEELNNQIIADL